MGCCKLASVQPEFNEATSQNTSTATQKRRQKLPEIGGLSSNDAEENRQRLTSWSPTSIKPIPSPLKRKSFDESNHVANNFINVLLLGESGVGKSTFINAIVNYLTFDTLEQARSGQPIALMPVSFLMTVGDQFEERIIRFGSEDSNEDHNHPGQSVTQRCRSYVFTIGTRTRIRLIDTPGMGDTRGLDQDDLNMQRILSFINNLSHLNAICILLKPNESRLNVVFRSYFSRLVGFLGENVRNNIIFCFTNTRATFFSPGNTGPLLRETLANLPIKHIPFKKSNTFCFDNESFRYLMAQQNGIEFDDYQKEEYQESWMTSVNESNRLLGYICGALKTYSQTEWKSIEHAQFQINQMIRPILETMRNLFRNLILQEENSPNLSIRLCPTVLSRPSTICKTCKCVLQQYSDFWILLDGLHLSSDKCASCECSRKRYINVDYRLDYKLSEDVNRQSVDEINLNLDQLKQAILKFGYFFIHTTHTSESNDPILFFLNQMIEEENRICQEKGTKYLNSILHKKLIQFKEEYEQRQSTSMANRNSINLASIYKLIQSVNEIDLIKEQMDVIKQSHQKYMHEQEKQLS